MIDRRKESAARLSVAYNVVGTLVKTAVAIPTGSLGLIAEAAHSLVDVVSSGIAWFSVRYAAKPADEDHPYGHGKMEAISGLVEALLLVATAGPIMYAGVTRLASGAAPAKVETGLIVMALSALSALAVGFRVRKVGRETQSPALIGNANHLFADAGTSLGVLGGLAAVKVTHWPGADAVVGIVLGAWMLIAGLRSAHDATHDLLDRAIPEEELSAVKKIIEAYPGVISYHALRARHVGSMHDVDVHVVVPREWSVVEAHDLADGLELAIEDALKPCRATIHVDPAESTGPTDRTPDAESPRPPETDERHSPPP